jgi:23S rRNA pseudouridine2457 synthase
MGKLVLFNKPFGVICQFSRDGVHQTLADYISLPNFYPAGRLDTDSEGLIVLTDDGQLQHRITAPEHKLPKTYWAQVEGMVSENELEQLRQGITLSGYTTLPAEAAKMNDPPGLWARIPPIRVRKNIPTSWLSLTLREGKNRQVRHMTAAVGLPTLRLIRFRIGEWTLADLPPGHWRRL